MPVETIYQGPAHDATFDVPSAGIVRFLFRDRHASGFVYARDGGRFRMQPGARHQVEAGQYVLVLDDPKPTARISVSITFEPL